MILYLLRHAKAVDDAGEFPDGVRWLSEEGRSRFRRAAGRLADKGMSPDAILVSPLVRAVQTAEILACALAYEGPLPAVEELASGVDRSRLVTLLASFPEAREMVLVGHNPDLSALATELSGENIELKKGETVALSLDRDRPAARASVLWRVHEKKGE